MECPVCGGDCLRDAPAITAELGTVFAFCPECRGQELDKGAPPADRTPAKICSCGKRYIDQVFAHCWLIMTEEGTLKETSPLRDVGIPLVHPGFAMTEPPYLPADSLVLLSVHVTTEVAERLVAEVPEIRGVIRKRTDVPGLSDIDRDGLPDTNELLAGCDVRANVFYNQNAPVVVYKQQSLMHIEFPRGYDPKIISVAMKVRQHRPETFVDACSGAGTLGIVAGQYENLKRLYLNDAWFPAAWWSACNLHVNRETLGIREVEFMARYDEMKDRIVAREPLPIAEASGRIEAYVYQADFRLLHSVLPENVDLTALDLFWKQDGPETEKALLAWKRHVGGEVFIP